MKMFSDCSGSCEDCVISYIGGCLAGHGDDDFYPISEETAKRLIKERKLKEYQIERLKKKFPSLNDRQRLLVRIVADFEILTYQITTDVKHR